MKRILTILFSMAMLWGCGEKKDLMKFPDDVKETKHNVNYMLQKISDIGDVRWYEADFKKGDRIHAKARVSKKLGVQLHVDLLKKNGDRAPTLVKKGKDDGVDSEVKAKIKEKGTYYFRVHDRGNDNEISGLMSGFTFYYSKR